MSNNYIYRYGQFAVKKVLDGFVVVNLKANYECHSHIKSVQAGKALCKLASKRKIPRNRDLYFIESLIRISNNRKYLLELNSLKNNASDQTFNKKEKNDEKSINKTIDEGITEYYNKNNMKRK